MPQKAVKFFALFLCVIFIDNPACAIFESKKTLKTDVQKITARIEYTNQEFFKRFNDPILEAYILEALENNNNLRKTAWQIEEYRQGVKYSFGRELPSLSVGANYLGVDTPKIGGLSSISKNAFLLPFTVSYEADILLKNRDKTRSSEKTYEAAQYEEKAVNISLVTDLASLYANIVQYDKLVELQENILDIKKEKLNIASKSFQAGVLGVEHSNKAKQDVENSLQSLDALKRDRENILNSFSVLLGRSSNNIDEIQRSSIDNFEYSSSVPEVISSDVTFSRPDVMAVEAKLAAANFDVRVARKELFPTFNITGILSFSTLSSGSFFSWDSSLAALLAGATQDLFKGGMKIANLKMNKAKYEQMFEEYRFAELNAIKEVNDALCIVKYDSEIDKSAQKKLELQQENFKNAKLKYESGTIALTEFLNEREQLLTLEQHKIQTKTSRIVNYFTLYKATGGVI